MRRRLLVLLVIGLLAALGGLGVANAGGNHSGDRESRWHDHGTTIPVDSGDFQSLGSECEGNSNLQLHNGFQSEDAVCVNTEFGEQSAFEDNPTLLIVAATLKVKVGQDIILMVSTRNLVRDRFLAAGEGGYYLESAFLNEEGLTRGHFHTGCRMLENRSEAPAPERLAEGQFVATEDSKGGSDPDVVRVVVAGFDEPGVVQCASWAGDGSHRMPMTSFANQIPAFDAVRIRVIE